MAMVLVPIELAALDPMNLRLCASTTSGAFDRGL